MRLNYVVQALPMKLAIAVLVVNVSRNLAAMKTCIAVNSQLLSKN